MTHRFASALFVLAMAAFPALAQDAAEVIHGVTIADPFRALEVGRASCRERV